MNLEPEGLVDVIRTSDGCYVGRPWGDIGYNVFLGRPSPGPAGRAASWRKFRALTLNQRKGVVLAARRRNVDLRQFLVKG